MIKPYQHEQRRYEIAKEMFPTVFEIYGGYVSADRIAIAADTAVACADALLARLSKGSVNPEDMAESMTL